MKTVHLHIDRIAVEGLDEMGQRQFARTLEQHLRAWAAKGGVNGVANPRIHIPTLDAGLLKPGTTARQAAAQVVNSLARHLATRRPGNRNSNPYINSHRPANAGGAGAADHV